MIVQKIRSASMTRRTLLLSFCLMGGVALFTAKAQTEKTSKTHLCYTVISGPGQVNTTCQYDGTFCAVNTDCTTPG